MVTYADMKVDVDEQIKGVNRYNPNQIEFLERIIHLMVQENQYDKDILLTTLKLYQLNPASYNENIVKWILMKAMMVFPRNDYALAKYLIDTPKANSPELRRIMDIGALLEANNFCVFWKLMSGAYKPSEAANEKFKNPADVAKLVRSIPGFEDSVRTYVCRVVNITFQNIDKDLLARLLGNPPDEMVNKYAKEFKWTSQGETYFVQNHEESVKSNYIDEKLTLNDVKSILTGTKRRL
ncbi:hypothetical protein L596_021313 [Steinernema carpocapsae]|uniref:Eukaryotic translation initiation factor 3 subunit K n=1 Tax=Steinernema carpocapsae TaxID=34508 RepID=A0A4U5MIC1_STECR|nr:hypothetical protein L596_021313 [Steinernema carpocapsae]